MGFWIFLGIVFLIFLTLKVYVIRGVKQAFRKKWVTLSYAIFSIATLVIGLPTMVFSFSHGIINLNFWQNFTIALMASVFLCEVGLLIFFLFDDILLLGQWIFRKMQPAEKRTVDQQGRRRFVKTVGMSVLSLPFTSFLYGITLGKYNFKVLRETLTFPDLPEAFDGFTLVQFSDLHSGGFDSMDAVKRGLALIQEQQPDLILFTGDLVNDLAEEIEPYKHLLTALNAPFGKFSVLGNHDYPQDRELFKDEAEGQKNLAAIRQHHADMQFRLLDNENVLLEKDGASIRLIGVENWGKGFIQEGDLDRALVGTETGEFSMLMSHDPTHWEEKVIPHDRHIHLTLAGHTHGMQLGIEMMGIQWSPVQYMYRHWAGLYQEKGQYLYVNRGFGFMAFAGRVGIPPEITVITLKSGSVS